MSEEIRKTEGPRDEADDELTTADLAGTNQRTPKDEAPRIENERRSAERLDGRTDVRTDVSFTGDASRVRSRGTAAASAPALEQETGPLFSGSEANDLRGKWDAIQVGFVDEPRRAVEQADSLVAGTMKRLAEVFAEERNMLENQWDKGENVSTEDLRLALRRYRSFFSRLLSV